MDIWQDLKNAIALVITSNANNEISGEALRELLNTMVVPSLGALQYKGVAVPATNPGTPSGAAFYLASTIGVYPNFGGYENLGELAALVYNHTTSTWQADIILTVEAAGGVTQAYVDAGDQAVIDYVNSVIGGGAAVQTQKIYSFSPGYIGGLSFKPYGDWEINGARHQLQVDPAISCDAAHPDYLRIDLMLLHDDGTITIQKGTAAENPTEPPYDTLTAIKATPIYIPAGSATPEGVEIATIYDENAGTAGGEWEVTKSVTAITLDSIERPKTGTKSIKIMDAPRFAQISLAPAEDLPAGTISEIKLEIYLETALPAGENPFRFSATSWTESRRGRPTLVVRDLPELTAYGFNPTLTGVWQFVSLPFGDTTLTLSSLRMRVLTDTLYTCFVDNITYNDGSMPVGQQYATTTWVEENFEPKLPAAPATPKALVKNAAGEYAWDSEVFTLTEKDKLAGLDKNPLPVSTSRALAATDSGRVLLITAAVTLTWPAGGLSPFKVNFDIDAAGQLTIADSAGTPGADLDAEKGTILEAGSMGHAYSRPDNNKLRLKGDFIE